MSANGGAWGVALWRDGYSGSEPQLQGISLEGGDPIVPYLPTEPLGCLKLPPDGLGVPPVRNGDVVFAQRDGVVQFGDFYEPRILTFQVSVCNEGCPGCSPLGDLETFLLLNGVAPGRARTPDAASLDITGDLDVRAHVALDDWTPAAMNTMVSKFTTTGNQRSWRFMVFTTGALRVVWSADGTGTVFTATSTVAPVIADGEDLWVRFTLDVDNGAAGRTITFYTSTDGVTWTVLGAPVVQAGVTSIFSGTAAVNIGAHTSGTAEMMSGKVFYAEIRNGIGGTVVANPDFTAQGPGQTTFFDSTGKEWTVEAPAVIAGEQGPPPLTGRQKVKRLTSEWSRSCTGATLVIFSDCHNPDATEEEKTYLGPYIVHGRPRGAQVTWQRSNRGCADIVLRFDAEDARLLLADVTSGQPWSGVHDDPNITANGPAREIEVVGDFCAFAVYELSGPLTAPIEMFFTDEDAVTSSWVYNDDIAMGDTVTVDTKWGIAESGGIETTQFLSGDSQSPLPTGTNQVNMTTGNPADTGSAQIFWSNAVVSG